MRAAGEGGGARGNLHACGAIVRTFLSPNASDAATMHIGHDLIPIRPTAQVVRVSTI